MLNPHYPNVSACEGSRLVSDSGAFQLKDLTKRLDPDEALNRQLRLRDRVGRPFEAIVTYDCLLGVDEAVVNGKRVKRRGTDETAAPAVEATIRGAEAYAKRRGDIGTKVAWAAQGASTAQYLQCVREVLQFAQPGDWLALGGFCIVGMQPSLKPLLYAAARGAIPLAREAGCSCVHILGVGAWDCLLELRTVERESGIPFRIDTSSIEVNSIMGKVWHTDHLLTGRSPWRKVYAKEDKYVRYHPCDLAHENIVRFNTWLTNLP